MDPFRRFNHVLQIYTAFKFESDTLYHLAPGISGLLRGGEGSPIDAAIPLVEGCSDKDIQNKITKLFDPSSEPLALVERIHRLNEITDVQKQRFLVGLDVKRLDGYYTVCTSLTGASNAEFCWQLAFSDEQRSLCAAYIIGFSAHPGWWALYPTEKLSREHRYQKWRVSIAGELVNTVPAELWPYMVHPNDQSRAIQDMLDYISGKTDQWKNPWTGVDYRCIRRPGLCMTKIIQASDLTGCRIIAWLRHAFNTYSEVYSIEDTRYAPLTCDFKITNRNNVTEQWLVELKSDQHCKLKSVSDRYILSHRQYHPKNTRKAPIFAADRGQWSWLMSVIGRFRPAKHELPKKFLFIHRDDVPQHWLSSAEEWLDWPGNPMTKAQLQAKFVIDVNQAEPHKTVAKMESWLKDHSPHPPLRARELLAISQEPAITAIDDEIMKLEDVEQSSTSASDSDDEISGEPEISVQRDHHVAYHQQDQIRRLLKQCRQRRRGLVFNCTSSQHGLRDTIYLPYRWSGADCEHFDQYLTAPRQLWQFPRSTKIMNLNFSPLPWPHGAEDPYIPHRLRINLSKDQERRPSIIIFNACGVSTSSSSNGVLFLVPSTHIQLGHGASKIPRNSTGFRLILSTGTQLMLNPVLEDYRVDNVTDALTKIERLWDNEPEPSTQLSEIGINLEDYVYRIADVYPTLLKGEV